MRHNILLKLFVVFIAALIWLQLALLKEHSEEISFPLKFTDLVDELVLEDNNIKEVNIQMRGRGLDFILLKMSDVYAEVDASGYKFGKNKLRIDQKNLRYSERFKLHVLEINLEENTYVSCDRILEVEKPIQIQYANASEEEYFIENKITNSNQKISVKGPSRILDDYSTVKTAKLNSKMVEDGEFSVDLILPDSRLELGKNSVILVVAQTKLINKTITLIPIEYPLDENIAIIPQKVTIMLRGPEEIVLSFTADSVRAFIDSRDVRKALVSGENLAGIQFELPSGVKILEHTPQRIQIIKNE